MYSKNLREDTDFLIIAATQIATKKLTIEIPIVFIVNANALILTPPLTNPHFKFLNSALLVDLVYL